MKDDARLASDNKITISISNLLVNVFCIFFIFVVFIISVIALDTTGNNFEKAIANIFYVLFVVFPLVISILSVKNILLKKDKDYKKTLFIFIITPIILYVIVAVYQMYNI